MSDGVWWVMATCTVVTLTAGAWAHGLYYGWRLRSGRSSERHSEGEP